MSGRGALDNKQLLEDLRVHRSSAVLAALARLPGMKAVRGALIGVQLRR